MPRHAQRITLIPFVEDLLASVQPWFRHPEVRRRLGGPDWPARELRLLARDVGEQYRGRTVLRVHSWIAVDEAGVPIAKIGGDVYDRWTRWDGSRPDRPVVSATEPGPAMGMAYVVDPAHWGEGIGRAVLLAAVEHTDVTDVRVFAAGIDSDNSASRRCAAGFAADRSAPDWEDTVYYLLRRTVPTTTPEIDIENQI